MIGIDWYQVLVAVDTLAIVLVGVGVRKIVAVIFIVIGLPIPHCNLCSHNLDVVEKISDFFLEYICTLPLEIVHPLEIIYCNFDVSPLGSYIKESHFIIHRHLLIITPFNKFGNFRLRVQK